MLHLKPKVVLIGAISFLTACSASTPQPTQAPRQKPLESRPTAMPTRAVAATTSLAVDGVLALALPQVALSFDVSGRITAVNATLGQAVKKGDVLAAIDNTALKNAVADAQLALDQLEANIRLQNVPPSKADLAAATAALNAAYASYNVTKDGASQTSINNARMSADAAWLSYLSAQSSRDAACGSGTNTQDCKLAEASYGNAYESMLSAREAYHKLLKPVSQDALTQAYSSVVAAQTRLDALNAGASAEQRKIAEVQVAQAQAALALAQDNLNKAKLISPCDCIVQAVDAAVGVGVTAHATAFVLVNLTGMQFKTTNLVERDVAKIQIGAPVTIRLRSYPDIFNGKVSALLAQSSGTQTNGEAVYTALIDLNPARKVLLPGMSGQAEIALR